MWTNKDKRGRYEIRRDETVGFYFYRYNEEGKCTHDYLQDTLESAVSFASEEFGVNRKDWQLEPENE